MVEQKVRCHGQTDTYMSLPCLRKHEVTLPTVPPPPRPGFRVPDEDQDLIEDHPRENSIQIIEARPHTYSVPSSSDDEEFDSEDDEIDTSSVQAGSNQPSAATTPDYKPSRDEVEKDEKKATGEEPRRNLDLKGPSLLDLLNKSPIDGSSQQNPIDLEDEPLSPTHIDNTESEASEDRGPEVLPVGPSAAMATDRPIPPPRPQRPQSFLEQVEGERPSPVKEVVLETQAHTPVSKADAENSYPSLDARQDEELDLLSAGSSPSVGQEAHENAEDPVKAHHSMLHPRPEVTSPCAVSQSVSGLDISRSKGDETSIHQRPPSPSDAALAKTPVNSNIPTDSFTGFKAYAQPGPSALPSMRSLGDDAAPRLYYYPEPWNPYNPNGRPENIAKSDPYSDSLYKTTSPCSRPDHEPIANSLHNRLPFSPVDDGLDVHGPGLDYAENFFDQPMCVPALGYNENPLISSPYHGPSPQRDSLVSPSHHGPSVQEPPFPREPSSRLNISNLINDSHGSSQQRVHKRKADEMDYDDIIPAQPADSDASRQGSTPAPVENETQLPDAQIRDEPAINPVTSLSQEELIEPLTSSVRKTVRDNDIETQAPSRKRAKTASSTFKVGGIAKFVSGVCVGVVGVLAALIATVPASVQEEALREAANLA